MQTATVSQLKKELILLDRDSLLKICLKLARFKKENKELLTYLIFDSADEDRFKQMIREELEIQILDAKKTSLYQTKKAVRKTLRYLEKIVRFSGHKETEVELRLHLVRLVKETKIPIHRSKVLENMVASQLKKIKMAMEKLHEDLQYDYGLQLDDILNLKR